MATLNNQFMTNKMEVILQTKVRLRPSPDKTVQDKKEPVCYILLREQGGACTLKNEFWALMYGDNALRVFKPGQEVEVELSFSVHKNSHKRYLQRVVVEKISIIEWYEKINFFPWEY